MTTRRDVPARKLQRLDVTDLAAGEAGVGALIVGHVTPVISSPDGVERVQVLGLAQGGALVLVGVEPDRMFPVYFYDGPGAGPGQPPEKESVR